MLEIPYFLVISKMDKYDKFTDNEKIEKIKILKNKIENFCKINFHYKFKKIEIIYNTKELTKLQVLKMMSENIKLMIPISVVTRENIKSLHKVLNFLPTINFKQNNNNFDDSIFMLYDTIYLPDIGIAAIGRVLEGSIKIGNELLIGPIDNSFSNVTVKSIHKKQITSQKICKNSHGSLVLKFNDKKLETKITKQLMLMTPKNINKFVNKFFILLNNKIIKQNKKKGYTFHNLNANKIEKKNYIMIYSNNIYENIIVMNIIKTEKKVILHVKFKKEKIKYISDGSSIIINFPQVFLFGKTFKKLNKIINKD
jgi:GTPase